MNSYLKAPKMWIRPDEFQLPKMWIRPDEFQLREKYLSLLPKSSFIISKRSLCFYD